MKVSEVADILEQMASGINPETGKSAKASEVLESSAAKTALWNAVKILRNQNKPSIESTKGKILFYRTSEKYGFLSNFSKYSFTSEGKLWPTSEHYFQAKKFQVASDEEEIRLAKTAGLAAKMGRQRSRPLRKDWETVKDKVMYTALRAKFSQNEGIKSKLLDTGEREIVEHTTNDSYWGDGGDGTGKNMLGKLLMELRNELRNGYPRGESG